MTQGHGEPLVRKVAFALIALLMSILLGLVKLQYDHITQRIEVAEQRIDEAAKVRMANIERDTVIMMEQKQQRAVTESIAKEIAIIKDQQNSMGILLRSIEARTTKTAPAQPEDSPRPWPW